MEHGYIENIAICVLVNGETKEVVLDSQDKGEIAAFVFKYLAQKGEILLADNPFEDYELLPDHNTFGVDKAGMTH